jgi:hypothetical protein
VNITLVVFQEIQRPLLAPVVGEVIDCQRRISAPSDIGPQPCLLELSVPLDLQRDDGIICKNHIALKNSPFQLLAKGTDCIISLEHPTCLGRPRDVHPLPLKDAVLAVKRKMVGKLAHNDVGKKPNVGLALLDGVIRHGGGDDTQLTAAMLGAIDRDSWAGRRDHTLLSLAVHTGLRVSELIHLHCSDVSLGAGASIHCHGKGRKERWIPIDKSIAKIIKHWLREQGGKPSDPLFPNRLGGELSRDGVQYILGKYIVLARKGCPSLEKKRITPHVLRHTTAVHLLQAGVDLSDIALWLGHESPESTQVYIDSDLAHKERILAKTIAINAKPLIFRPSDALMRFLEVL